MIDPVILALDFESSPEARLFVDRIGDAASFYKVGLELFTSAGPDFVRTLKHLGKRVFLDLKLYDIGETVRRAVVQAALLDADFLTVHGSPSILRAAAEGRATSNLKLLAVTVLTSLDEQDLHQMGYCCPPEELVAIRARYAAEVGIDGLVCSALEAPALRQAHPRSLLVTPGVRSADTAIGDQKRITTPAQALQNGADFLVIGRQVTRAVDPLAALQAIRAEIEPHLHPDQAR